MVLFLLFVLVLVTAVMSCDTASRMLVAIEMIGYASKAGADDEVDTVVVVISHIIVLLETSG